MKVGTDVSWDRQRAREGQYDGQFVVGVMTSGTYSLPSCAAIPQQEHMQVFDTEVAARLAGLRACKVCRPDKFYATGRMSIPTYEKVTSAIALHLRSVDSVAAAANQVKLSMGELENLTVDHAHLMPAQWLSRMRVNRAAELLARDAGQHYTHAGEDAGFSDLKAFEREFFQQLRMAPEDYQRLANSESFVLRLPKTYRPDETLAYHGRDPQSPSERLEGRRLLKAYKTSQSSVILELQMCGDFAPVRVHAKKPLAPGTMFDLHAVMLRMLGARAEIEPFERQHSTLVEKRRGLRVPLAPNAFEALAWAITRQKIDLNIATMLRRALTERIGKAVSPMKAHPTAADVAKLDSSDLTALGFSRSKARYLLTVARAIQEEHLPLERLPEGSAVHAEALLSAQQGVGFGTARYVMMRMGFADAAPIGDSGLSNALLRVRSLNERPDAEMTARLMNVYSPYRSLASIHLLGTSAEPGQ